MGVPVWLYWQRRKGDLLGRPDSAKESSVRERGVLPKTPTHVDGGSFSSQKKVTGKDSYLMHLKRKKENEKRRGKTFVFEKLSF